MTDRLNESAQERTKRIEDNLHLCLVASHVTNRHDLLQRTEDFLHDSSEEELSGRLKLWRLNCEALHTENVFFASYGLMASMGDIKGDQAFWDEATRAFARELSDESRDPLKISKMLNTKPLTPYKGWEEDVATLSELIESFQPLTLARSDIVKEVCDTLRRVDGAGLAEAFDGFYAEISHLRTGMTVSLPQPAPGPNPALP